MSSLVGTQAVLIYRKADEATIKLVRDILMVSHHLYLGELGRSFIETSFAAVLDALRAKTELDGVFDARRDAFACSGLDSPRRMYKEGSLRRTIRLLSLEGFEGHIVDVGAADNMLGWTLTQNLAPQAAFTGIDIARTAGVKESPRLHFIQQGDPTVIPLEDRSVDICLFRFSLHHMEYDVQQKILEEAQRVTASSGRIVLVEDSYSLALPALADNMLHRVLLGLDKRIWDALALLDASSCLVTEETMTFPFSFRSVEDWQSLGVKIGLELRRVDYWGLPFFSLYQAPLAILNFGPGESC